MEEIIKVQKLEKVFGTKENENKVLKGLNFTIKEGEFVSIMGPSGCGKSTLLYLLGGLDKPTKGFISILGEDITSLKEKDLAKFRRKKIGFVFQFYNLVQNLNVEENIMLPVVMDSKRENDYKEYLDELLKIVGLDKKRKSLPHELSGGEQQRVSIARAIILNPKVILADEPIGNLDSKAGTEIMNLFKKINKEKGITIIQVTHSLESAEVGDRIINIKDGRIV